MVNTWYHLNIYAAIKDTASEIGTNTIGNRSFLSMTSDERKRAWTEREIAGR